MGEAEIISAAIAIVGSVSFAVIYWQRFKARLSLVRQLFDIVDDALTDDLISEKEWQGIWIAVKKIVTAKKEEEL